MVRALGPSFRILAENATSLEWSRAAYAVERYLKHWEKAWNLC